MFEIFGWDFEDELWSRFVFELVIWPQEGTLARWTQPSGPLCLWQCFTFLLSKLSCLNRLELCSQKSVIFLFLGTNNIKPLFTCFKPWSCKFFHLMISFSFLHDLILRLWNLKKRQYQVFFNSLEKVVCIFMESKVRWWWLIYGQWPCSFA